MGVHSTLEILDTFLSCAEGSRSDSSQARRLQRVEGGSEAEADAINVDDDAEVEAELEVEGAASAEQGWVSSTAVRM